METLLTTDWKTEFLKFGLDCKLAENANGKPNAHLTRPQKGHFVHKTIFFYRFDNEIKREVYLQNYLDGLYRTKQAKEEKKAKNKQANSNLVASNYFKVGDIVLNTWGWEQTNVQFYKVMGVLPKSIRVIEIGQQTVENSYQYNGMACDVLPDDTRTIGKEFILRLKVSIWSDGKPTTHICNPARYYYFHKWDGRPQYKSWYA